MTRFFTEWPTWEKLCFILACAIAVTLIAGAVKLGYTHWKLRKYVAVAEREKREQTMQRQISLRRNTSTRSGPNTSFGIEALEKGQVVEGIWVSRSNTPEPDSRASSFAQDNTRTWDTAAFARPHAGQSGHHTNASYSLPSSRARPSGSTERTRSTERLPSRPGTSETDLARPGRSEHPPSSMSKYNSILPALRRQDSGVSTVEAIEAIYDAAGPMKNGCEHVETGQSVVTNGSSCHSSSESSESDPIAASAPRLLNQQPRPRQKSSDLDLMQSHRISLAAETGQLAPRRRPGPSGDWTSIKHGQRPSTASEPEYFSQRQSSRSPAEDAVQTWSHPSTCSKFDALPAAVRRSSLPDVTPFAKFCKTAPSSPLPEVHRLSGARDLGVLESRAYSKSITAATAADHEAGISLVELPAPTRPPGYPHPTLEDHTPSKQPEGSFEHRASAVIRGHGTGFEILKQGTFTNAPPISLQNGSRSRSSSIESRRKLRKKRRPSEESQRGPPSRASLV